MRESVCLYLSRELILAEKAYYKELVEKFEKELLLLPIGSIAKKRIKGRDYLYLQTCKAIQGKTKICDEQHSNSSKKKQIISTYLKKGDMDIVTGIARKRFIEKSMPKLRKILTKKLHKIHPNLDNPQTSCPTKKQPPGIILTDSVWGVHMREGDYNIDSLISQSQANILLRSIIRRIICPLFHQADIIRVFFRSSYLLFATVL